MPITAKQIREIELPTSRRGFDKQATRDLLESAAKALTEAIAERDELRRKLDELSGTTPIVAAEPPAPTAVAPAAALPEPVASSHDLESIGAALLAAQRAGERLVQEARDEAAQVRADADLTRHALLREAQADAASQLEGVKQRLEAVKDQEANLRAMLGDRRIELAEFVHRAVDRLASSRPHGGAETLETVLRERVQEAHEPAGDAPAAESTDTAA